MPRLIAFAILAALTAPASAQTPVTPVHVSTTSVPVLKRAVTVTGDVVHIGDLFNHAGRYAGIPVFRAPDIGTTGTVSVRQIADVVRTHDLILFDTAGATEVRVTHEARAITADEIRARIVNELAARHAVANTAAATLTSDRPINTIYVEPSVRGELQIARLSYEPHSGRFDAVIELPEGTAAQPVSLRVTGTMVETVEVGFIGRAVERGEVIDRSDISFERRPKNQVGPNAVTDLAQVAGFAAGKPLRAGQMLKRADLMKPEIVRRNEMITIMYEAPGIVLSTRGKALETGAAGDTISVLNEQSKRTLQGTIIGPGRVAVTPHAERFATNFGSPSTATAPRRRAE